MNEDVAVGRTRALALAGIIGPIWFTTLVVVQRWLLPDYSHVRLPISALAAWPTGWLQNVNDPCEHRVGYVVDRARLGLRGGRREIYRSRELTPR